MRLLALANRASSAFGFLSRSIVGIGVYTAIIGFAPTALYAQSDNDLYLECMSKNGCSYGFFRLTNNSQKSLLLQSIKVNDSNDCTLVRYRSGDKDLWLPLKVVGKTIEETEQLAKVSRLERSEDLVMGTDSYTDHIIFEVREMFGCPRVRKLVVYYVIDGIESFGSWQFTKDGWMLR